MIYRTTATTSHSDQGSRINQTPLTNKKRDGDFNALGSKDFFRHEEIGPIRDGFERWRRRVREKEIMVAPGQPPSYTHTHTRLEGGG